MNPLAIFHPHRNGWKGCRPLSASERMARYSPRRAEEITQRENAGAAAPRTRLVDGRIVLIALPGKVNPLPKDAV